MRALRAEDLLSWFLMASWLVALTVGTLLTRTTTRQRPDNKLKKLRCCLLLHFSAAMRRAVFPP
jgi:hypothetical protein